MAWINSKLEQVLSLRELTTKATATMSDMPSGGTRNVYRMQDIIGKIVDLENEINRDIDELIDLKREMVAAIKAVVDPESSIFRTKWMRSLRSPTALQ